MNLEIENLSFSFNGVPILNDISFSLPDKGIMAIIGHNGSGKSTLLKIIAGIYRDYEGKCLLGGRDIKDISFAEISKFIAYVPGEIFCPFDFKVENIIAMGLNPYKKWWQDFNLQDMAEVNLMMKKMNIGYLKGRSINKISSGEKQMVFLAQAIIQKPYYLLLDEPTSHLDLNFRIKIMEILSNIKSKISIILISHDLKAVSLYCDLCLALKQGKNIFFGSVDRMGRDLIVEAYNVESAEKLSNFL